MDSIGAGRSNAAETLARVFAAADSGAADLDTPIIGVFGNGAPETLIAASGATPVHVNFGARDESITGAMDAAIEPFVDPEVRIFLNRFADGAFDGFAGIVFVRDDAPALTAYQYALEWVRQGRAKGATPPLFLLNTIHAATAPVRAFNRTQIEKLIDFLTGIGLARVGDGELAEQVQHATRRHRALGAVTGSAADAMVFRNAGRFLPMQRHAQLLEEAADKAEPADAGGGVRLGIVGSPLFSERAHMTFGKYGSVVCDVQPFGQVWPGAWEDAATVETMLERLAGDAFCHRISPPNRYREAVVEALVAARCELVLCQLAQTDDTFGWEIPDLSRQLAASGIGFVNLGFRDAQPDDAWLARAGVLIERALEARP